MSFDIIAFNKINAEILKNIKSITTNTRNVMIMNIKIWKFVYMNDQLIKQKYNIIISKDDEVIQYHDCITATSFDRALQIANSFDDKDNIYVIGGSEIYDISIKHKDCKNIYLFDDEYCSHIPKYFVSNTMYKPFCDQKDKSMLATFATEKVVNNSCKFITYSNISNPNSDEKQYLDLIKTILSEGDIKNGRNGKTLSIFGPQHIFDLQKGFPLLSTKKMFFEGIVKELLFFLKGQTDSKILSNDGVKIWEPNTTPEFLANRKLNYEQGDIGPMYGFNWRFFGAEYKGCGADYTNKGFDQLHNLIKSLIDDRDSRRHLMTTYDPTVVDLSVLAPCHGLTIQFYVNQSRDYNEYFLNCKMYQRSVDVGLGYPFNIASYALLIHIICQVTGYLPGKLIMTLGDTHIYESHIEKLKLQSNRIPMVQPKINIVPQFKIDGSNINDRIKFIENLKYEDIILENYNCYPGIKLDMIA